MIRCPMCKSIHIYPLSGGYTGWQYRCKDCGYIGALVIEYLPDEKETDPSKKE